MYDFQFVKTTRFPVQARASTLLPTFSPPSLLMMAFRISVVFEKGRP